MRFLKTSPAMNGRVWYLLISVIMLIGSSQSIYADGFVRRSNHSARLEPIGKVIHGAGPSPTDFRNYWNVMGEGNKPMVYMDYVGLRGITREWPDRLKAELLLYSPRLVIPQIGLAMTSDGHPETHYEDEVAAGLLDDEIGAFLDGLEDLALPAYLRIGYEFNGSAWNGYEPDTYIQAFRRITEKIRERGLEVATVWDAAAAGDHNYYEYYPGNDYVDWWGINTFEPNHFRSIGFPTHEFLDLAEAHNRPVMLGESTAKGTGVLDGEISWNEWFVPYFQFIRSYPGIKMFCYINFDWRAYSQWEDWGDCRLEQNDYVSEHFDEEMWVGLYQHAASESDFRETLGHDDNTAPATIPRVASDHSSYPVVLQWDPIADPCELSHYIVYRNEDIAGYTLLPRFACSAAGAGDVVNYRVTAMDRAGNENPMSEAVRVVVPNSIPKAVNGEFDNGFDGWSRNVWDGSADFSIDASSAVSGVNSAHIDVTSPPGADWSIQLRQLMKVHKGRKYTISYKAKASKEINLPMYVPTADNSDSYLWKSVPLSPDVQSFTQSMTVDASGLVYLTYLMGGLGEVEVWIDAVSVTEEKPTTDLVNFSVLADEWMQCNRIPSAGRLIDMPTPVSPLPEAHWKLDEIEGSAALDSAGDNHGALHSNPIRQITGGVLLGSLCFDGVDDYVDCGAGPSLNITDAVTICAWIRPHEAGVDHKIAAKQDGVSGGYKMGVYYNRLEFEIRDASNHPTLTRGLPGGTVLQTDVWYHVAGVYSQGDYIRTYVNGILDRELSTSAVLAPTEGPMMLGRAPFADHSFFNGCIDDIRVYAHALTENEIVQLLCVKPPAADFNGDCRVDWADLTAFSSMWLE